VSERRSIRGSSVDIMNKNLQIALGALLVLMGLIWTLQGVNVLKGSTLMSGKPLWAIIGPVVAIIGAFLVTRAVRARH
jgi:hypothetical protein